jgi:hypothetical protein
MLIPLVLLAGLVATMLGWRAVNRGREVWRTLPSILGVFGVILANVPSRSLPIIAGAIVGGALWGGLARWSDGVLAPLASHILWTGSMLALPPKVGRAEGDG